MDEESPISSPISIGELEEWRLLIAVCPVFGYDHPWTALESTRKDVEVVKTQANLLKANIMEIPVHIDTNCMLTGDIRDDFTLAMNALLSTLEGLVDGAKLPAREDKSSSGTQPSPPSDICCKCPNLSAISTLILEGSATTPIKEFGRYLRLRQAADSFKRTRFAVQQFHASTRTLLSETAFAPAKSRGSQALTVEPQSCFSYTFWSSSTRLFESLVTHLRLCDEMHANRNAKYLEHKAMLHLRHPKDSKGGDNCPEVCIALASCPDRRTWHQTLCAISTQWYAPALNSP